MDVMTKPLRTACHHCRPMGRHRTETADGVVRVHDVPEMGDGTVIDLVATAGGYTAPQARTCPNPDCVDGWIPGFQPPC